MIEQMRVALSQREFQSMEWQLTGPPAGDGKHTEDWNAEGGSSVTTSRHLVI